MGYSKKEVTKNTRNGGIRAPPLGYELLGSTAIIEYAGTLSEQKIMAQALAASNPRIKTVLAKAGPVQGRFRTRKLRFLYGERKWTVKYRENNCDFVFDPRRTFFSSKLSFERSRIVDASKDGEKIMVMFAGVGPFAIELAKAHRQCSIAAIEENPYAYRRMRDNIRLNRLENVVAIEGDVAKVWRRYADSADRVVMPLPWSSLDFLDAAFGVAHACAIVHIYVFGNADNVVDDSWGCIRAQASKEGCVVKLLFTRVVRTYSAREIEVAIDFEVKKPKSMQTAASSRQRK